MVIRPSNAMAVHEHNTQRMNERLKSCFPTAMLLPVKVALYLGFGYPLVHVVTNLSRQTFN